MNWKENFLFLLKVSGRERYKLYLSGLFSILSSLLAIVPYMLMYNIIMTFFEAGVNFEKVKSQVLWVGIIVVIRMAVFLSSGVFSHIAAFTILYELRMQAVSHIAKLNMGFFTGHTLGEVKKTINEDVEKLENFIAHQIPDLASAIVTPIVLLIYLMVLDWRMGLVLFLPLILGFLVQIGMFGNMKERMAKYHDLLQKLSTTVIEYINGIHVMKAFNLSAKSFENYRDVTKNYADYWEEITRQSAPFYSAFLVIIDSGLLFMIPVGGYLYLRGEINVAVYILFLILSSIFLNSLKALLEFGSHLSILLEGAGKVKDILEKRPQSEGSKLLPTKIKGEIEFKDVTFKYDKIEVIKTLNLRIAPKTIIALVGPSGSGKTTIGQLIGRFWDVDQGTIKIDGIDVKAIKMESLMEHIAFVFQNPFMLHDTILENIRLGLDRSEQEVVEAAKKAQIHSLIMSLKEGYETKLGEGGIKLSGGEKQRIAIARAILKDSPIVILDEVTSYSDIENESKIQAALKNLLKNKTAVIIAHRLYTIKNADNIVVLDEGKIAQQGKHEDLMRENGLYKRLWQIGEFETKEIKGGMQDAEVYQKVTG